MTSINNELYLQVRIVNEYKRRHNLTTEQFLRLDYKYDILHMLEIGYEPFHLMGDEGILDEIDTIVIDRNVAG
ncbi:hypothetical protein FACS1894187_16000 [Synergistales bacterium]|nr:hypothetical protein FACS1894187_16000 [Synergistales bacterium]